jgi:peptidoglycan hydrolase-like protein with peptidoglycan-binding domain
MKKITEQQLMESARALNAYNAAMVEGMKGQLREWGPLAPLVATGLMGAAAHYLPKPMSAAEQERVYGPTPNRDSTPQHVNPDATVQPGMSPEDELNQGAQNLANISKSQKPASTTSKQSAKPSASRRDPAVEKLQKELRAKGYEIKVDGIMGPATKQALAYDQEFGADYAAKANKQIAQANESLDRIMELTNHSFSDKVHNRVIDETTAAFRDFIDNIEEAAQPIDPYYQLGQGDVSAIPDIYKNQPNAFGSTNPAGTALDRAKQVYRGAIGAPSQSASLDQTPDVPGTTGTSGKQLPPGVGGVLDQATSVQPVTTTPVKPTSQQFAMKPQSGYANIMNPNAQSTAKPTTPVQNAKPSSAVPADIYTNPTAIKAFQRANGLKDDGLIGPNTLQALVKQGVQPPAGFKPATAKQPAAKSVAKPVAKQVQNQMSVSQADYDAAEAEFQKNNAAHDAEYNAKLAAIRAPRDQAAAAAAAPQQGIPSAALNTVGQSITPNFQSQQPVKEHVQFGELDSLARIISLARH